MRALLRCLALGLLLPGTALAQAPFDLDALRDRWPGSDAVYLDRHITFSMPDADTLRVQTLHRLAVLSDSAQEDLVLFSVSRRPGCREPSGIDLRVTTARGEAVGGAAQLLELPSGNHPVHADRGSVMLSASRRGLGAGALLEERWTVDYQRACFDGFLGSERLIADAAWPIEHLVVDVPCDGDGCFAALDMPFMAAFAAAPGGGSRLEARDVPAPPPEFRVPQQGIPSVIVASSTDPFVAGRTLRGQLPAQIAQAERVAASHRAAASAVFSHVPDPTERLVRYLSEGLERLEDGAFWQFGFDWGQPPQAGRRPMLPLEWWALANVLLADAGAIPLLLDTESHRPPPDIGRLVSYDQVGVLIPGVGLATASGWFPTMGPASTATAITESHASLAGLWVMRLDGEPALARFPQLTDLEVYAVSGTMTPTTGTSLVLDVHRRYRGASGATLRTMWMDRLARWEREAPGRRESSSDEAREFVRDVLVGADVARTDIDLAPDDPSLFSLSTGYTREGLVQRADDIIVIALPLSVPEELVWLVGPEEGRQRSADYALSLSTDDIDLEVVAPAGSRLVGLPADVEVAAGDVSLSVDWSSTERGARLRYRCVVGNTLHPASVAGDLERVGEELRRLKRTRLLFEPE